MNKYICVICLVLCSCKGKTSTNPNTPLPPQNIIEFDLSFPLFFTATYLYGPSVLCNQSIVIGSAVLTCTYIDLTHGVQTVAFASGYTNELMAEVVNACRISGISSTSQFTNAPSISVACVPGTNIDCVANGVDPTRSATASGTCPNLP